MDDLFINRKSELTYLKEWLEQEEKNSKILLMRAPTGIGKTDLIKHAIKQSSMPAIHVQVVDHPDYIADNGEYILRLFRALAMKSKQDARIFDIEQFLALRSGRQIFEEALRVIAKRLALRLGQKYLGTEGVETFKEVLRTDTKSLYQLKDGKSEIIKNEIILYIDVVFSSVPCIVYIENIQKIDYVSLEYIRSAFFQYDGLKGIFEYTAQAKENISCETIQSTLKSEKVGCKIYELQPVPLEELLDGLKDRPEVFRYVLSKHYQAQSFNLRVIVDVNILATHSKNDLDNSDQNELSRLSEKAIRSLPNAQRLLLALLVTHGGEVDVEIIKSAISVNMKPNSAIITGINIYSNIDELCAIKYLSLEKSNIRVSHDSITRTFINDLYNKKFILIANEIWECFYSRILENDDPILKSDALYWLPIIYLGNDKTEQLITILERSSRDALKSLAPRRLVNIFQHIQDLISQMATVISPNRLDTLIEQQGVILFDNCLLNEACECFSKASKLSLVGRLIYADANVATARFREAISMIEAIERDYQETASPSRKVAMQTGLIKIHAFRTDGQLAAAESQFRELLTWKEFQEQPIYASLLRCADIGLYKDCDIPECIALLERAVQLCRQHGMQADEVAAHIALCQHFGYRGELIRAQEELRAADNLSQQVCVERYSIINNQAVLDIMSGNKNSVAIELQRALLLATEDGDRLLLLCNYLAVGDISIAEEIEHLLEKIGDLSEELAKIAHYNLSVFYAEQEDIIQSHFHRAKAASMADTMDEDFWGAALREEEPRLDATRHRLQMKYYLVFIVQWRLTSMTFQSVSYQPLQ